MEIVPDAIGIILLIFGTILGLKIKKRKFDRSNFYGIECYPSYWSKLATKAKDWVLKIGGIIFLTSGALLFSYNHLETWGWVVWLPATLFGLYTMI